MKQSLFEADKHSGFENVAKNLFFFFFLLGGISLGIFYAGYVCMCVKEVYYLHSHCNDFIIFASQFVPVHVNE